MSLQLFLLLAAGLFAIGLYGALSQQSIVMIMMGLELMLNGVTVAAAAFWHYVAPDRRGWPGDRGGGRRRDGRGDGDGVRCHDRDLPGS